MRPHYSQSSLENATPSGGTSLLATCKGVPPPPREDTIGFFPIQILVFRMLRNNADVRRCSYFESGLSVGSSPQQTSAPPCRALYRFRKFGLGRLAIK